MKLKKITALFLAAAISVGISAAPAEPVFAVKAEAASKVALNKKNFPDVNLRSFLRNQFDKDQNDVLSDDEIANVTWISCRGCKNAKGLEYFTELETLNIIGEYSGSEKEGNFLTSLDLSKNTKLKKLDCRNNKLKTLDLTKNPKLENLYCDTNPLKTLDLSKNKELTGFDGSHTKLTSLTIYSPKIQFVRCSFSDLTKLDVSRCPELSIVYCYNNKLKSIKLPKNGKVGELRCTDNNIKKLDLSRCKVNAQIVCDKDVIFCGKEGSWVEDYAEQQKHKFEAI